MPWNGFKRVRFRKKKDMPGGLWTRCPGCEGMQYKRAIEERLRVCPECNHHFEVSARERIAQLLDEGSFAERHDNMAPLDPLGFVARKSYKERLEEAQERTGLRDACVAGTGRVDGREVAFGVTDPTFLRGSMGSVVGEKIARIVDDARRESLPLVFVSGSGGGARMDEGVLSLMQMAKTSAALARFDEEGGLFISVLTNPTMGGAMASFAALGDILIAEPGALLGFAGPGVIKETIKSDLPKGFQTSEFLLQHGFMDLVVNRYDLKATIAKLLDYCMVGGRKDCSRFKSKRRE